MIQAYRREFNQRFTPERYQRFLALIDIAGGTHVNFRNCETPCFFPPELITRMARAGGELVEQLLNNPEYLSAAAATIPAEYRVAGEDSHPLFLQADFGIVRSQDGVLEPKLVEIQGFPSLYGFQLVLSHAYRDAYGLDPRLRALPEGLDEIQYLKLLSHAVLGDHAPENVVLLEIDPYGQKTLPDFLVTKRMLAIPVVDISSVRKDGRQLTYPRNGQMVPIRRIYNRAIVDELMRRRVPVAFDFRDDLDVEWAGHPNWFFKISKFSLPWFRHPTVPASSFLDRLDRWPENLDDYVLKPLFSFAGLGVSVGPKKEELDRIPPEARSGYILQERMNFEPVIETPFGWTKAEVRVMYIWTERLTAVNTIIRMGRGKMMGVDQNRDLEWVGASAGFLPPA